MTMDDAGRPRRREETRHRRSRHRRLAVAGLVVGAVAVGLSVRLVAEGGTVVSAGEEAAAPAQLPRGGRTILPGKRVVAYYGAPGDRSLGVLGIGSPEREARRLERQAAPYSRRGRPVLPALELIATLATAEAGEDGDHAQEQPLSTIRRYLRTARAHHMLLILDIQPGYASFLDQARRLRRFLGQPDVSLALDPEWSLEPPVLPGQEIGSTDASTINSVSRYLSRVVRRHDLPQKLLVVHRFTDEMIEAEARLRRRPGVALVLNVDGFGSRSAKVSKYRQLAHRRPGVFEGFKLFYEEDSDLMKPSQVLRLRPRPDLVVYE